ncbi:MAG: transcriptional repressor LexA [Acidobacteriota bacterium]|jgi:repressor LexA|nr:transcriptional repressor LexA [Acidobacteriota bacterium]
MLTRKQKKFLDQLTALTERLGYFPTVREIARETRLASPATVHAYLQRLAERGHLRHRDGRWELARSARSVPLVGIVPAGSPLDVFESLGDEVELPDWMVDRSGEMFAFRVQGESMRDAYIREGDVVIVRRGDAADPGAMVIAMLDSSAITLKRLRRGGPNGFYLMPENPEFAPIHEPFRVLGQVVGVMRRY